MCLFVKHRIQIKVHTSALIMQRNPIRGFNLIEVSAAKRALDLIQTHSERKIFLVPC